MRTFVQRLSAAIHRLRVRGRGLLGRAYSWLTARSPDERRWHLLLSVIGGLVTILAGALAFVTFFREDDPNIAPGALRPVADFYYTDDGSDPPVSPECWGMLHICLDEPPERATEILGRPNSTWGDDVYGRHDQWYFENDTMIVTVGTYEDSIESLSVALREGSDRLRVSLPEELGEIVLGGITMADAAATFGTYEPELRVVHGEGFTVYGYEWQVGPEGSILARFGTTLDWSEYTAPDPRTDRSGMASRLAGEMITSVTFESISVRWREEAEASS